jgi:hypothetical protein
MKRMPEHRFGDICKLLRSDCAFPLPHDIATELVEDRQALTVVVHYATKLLETLHQIVLASDRKASLEEKILLVRQRSIEAEQLHEHIAAWDPSLVPPLEQLRDDAIARITTTMGPPPVEPGARRPDGNVHVMPADGTHHECAACWCGPELQHKDDLADQSVYVHRDPEAAH